MSQESKIKKTPIEKLEATEKELLDDCQVQITQLTDAINHMHFFLGKLETFPGTYPLTKPQLLEGFVVKHRDSIEKLRNKIIAYEEEYERVVGVKISDLSLKDSLEKINELRAKVFNALRLCRQQLYKTSVGITNHINKLLSEGAKKLLEIKDFTEQLQELMAVQDYFPPLIYRPEDPSFAVERDLEGEFEKIKNFLAETQYELLTTFFSELALLEKTNNEEKKPQRRTLHAPSNSSSTPPPSSNLTSAQGDNKAGNTPFNEDKRKPPQEPQDIKNLSIPKELQAEYLSSQEELLNAFEQYSTALNNFPLRTTIPNLRLIMDKHLVITHKIEKLNFRDDDFERKKIRNDVTLTALVQSTQKKLTELIKGPEDEVDRGLNLSLTEKDGIVTATTIYETAKKKFILLGEFTRNYIFSPPIVALSALIEKNISGCDQLLRALEIGDPELVQATIVSLNEFNPVTSVQNSTEKPDPTDEDEADEDDEAEELAAIALSLSGIPSSSPSDVVIPPEAKSVTKQPTELAKLEAVLNHHLSTLTSTLEIYKSLSQDITNFTDTTTPNLKSLPAYLLEVEKDLKELRFPEILSEKVQLVQNKVLLIKDSLENCYSALSKAIAMLNIVDDFNVAQIGECNYQQFTELYRTKHLQLVSLRMCFKKLPSDGANEEAANQIIEALEEASSILKAEFSKVEKRGTTAPSVNLLLGRPETTSPHEDKKSISKINFAEQLKSIMNDFHQSVGHQIKLITKSELPEVLQAIYGTLKRLENLHKLALKASGLPATEKKLIQTEGINCHRLVEEYVSYYGDFASGHWEAIHNTPNINIKPNPSPKLRTEPTLPVTQEDMLAAQRQYIDNIKGFTISTRKETLAETFQRHQQTLFWKHLSDTKEVKNPQDLYSRLNTSNIQVWQNFEEIQLSLQQALKELENSFPLDLIPSLPLSIVNQLSSQRELEDQIQLVTSLLSCFDEYPKQILERNKNFHTFHTQATTRLKERLQLLNTSLSELKKIESQFLTQASSTPAALTITTPKIDSKSTAILSASGDEKVKPQEGKINVKTERSLHHELNNILLAYRSSPGFKGIKLASPELIRTEVAIVQWTLTGLINLLNDCKRIRSHDLSHTDIHLIRERIKLYKKQKQSLIESYGSFANELFAFFAKSPPPAIQSGHPPASIPTPLQPETLRFGETVPYIHNQAGAKLLSHIGELKDALISFLKSLKELSTKADPQISIIAKKISRLVTPELMAAFSVSSEPSEPPVMESVLIKLKLSPVISDIIQILKMKTEELAKLTTALTDQSIPSDNNLGEKVHTAQEQLDLLLSYAEEIQHYAAHATATYPNFLDDKDLRAIKQINSTIMQLLAQLSVRIDSPFPNEDVVGDKLSSIPQEQTQKADTPPRPPSDPGDWGDAQGEDVAWDSDEEDSDKGDESHVDEEILAAAITLSKTGTTTSEGENTPQKATLENDPGAKGRDALSVQALIHRGGPLDGKVTPRPATPPSVAAPSTHASGPK